jgi:hypothetical protein
MSQEFISAKWFKYILDIINATKNVRKKMKMHC